MTETKPLDIDTARSWLMFTWGAVISALRGEPDLREAFWRLIPFVSALMTVGERHPEETEDRWRERLAEPMPFGGGPLGVENALPKPLKEWTMPRTNATPVPAVEHQRDMARRQEYYASLQGDPARRPQSSLDIASATFAGHTDIASHRSYLGAEPSVRFVEPDRAAFIALYEAAQKLTETLHEHFEEAASDWTNRVNTADSALRGALDKAAPAYGRALVARAEVNAPAWSRRRDAPAPGVGYCSCKASADCVVHGARETGGQ